MRYRRHRSISMGRPDLLAPFWRLGLRLPEESPVAEVSPKQNHLTFRIEDVEVALSGVELGLVALVSECGHISIRELRELRLYLLG